MKETKITLHSRKIESELGNGDQSLIYLIENELEQYDLEDKIA